MSASTRDCPSNAEDYCRDQDEIVASSEWEHLTLNSHDMFDWVNRTARALTEWRPSVVAASYLHHRDPEIT